MEQRRLRLGDILDDYCPRERRVTNHAVVAMVEETVKQTRCSTCDTEHPYKGGHAPRRRKKETSSALYKEVLAGKPDTDLPVHAADAGEAYATDEAADLDAAPSVQPSDDAAGDDVHVETEEVPQPILSRPTIVARREVAPEPAPAQIAGAAAAPDAIDEDDRQGPAEEGPVHRQLIRAQLPRIEGQKEERRPTDFTIRQPGGRGGNQPGNQFRGGGNDRMRSGGRGGQAGNGFGNNGNGAGNRGNGHRPHGQRFAGARSGQGPGQGQGSGHGQGQGRGQGGGFRSSQQPRQGGGGRKRSR